MACTHHIFLVGIPIDPLSLSRSQGELINRPIPCHLPPFYFLVSVRKGYLIYSLFLTPSPTTQRPRRSTASTRLSELIYLRYILDAVFELGRYTVERYCGAVVLVPGS